MSKLQNYFTTFEQSKRLLELGVPADSADCYYARGFNTHTQNWNYDSFPTIIVEEMFEMEPTDIPCWSVGRLMEIYTICYDPDYIEFDTFADGTSFLRQILDRFENCIDSMDFSKLEE